MIAPLKSVRVFVVFKYNIHNVTDVALQDITDANKDIHETDSFRVKRAIVADDAPVARRRSVLFISLSIRSFHNFLYDTPTVKPLLDGGNILYHIS